MTEQHMPSAPASRRVDRGTRFWETPLPLAVLQRCAGDPLLLAAWVAVAATIQEDEALRGAARPASDLIRAVAQLLGLDGQPDILITSLLGTLGDRQLLIVADGQLAIPWSALAEASVAEAQRRQAAAEGPGEIPSAPHRQGALPGFAD
jgi:hypothetical protein